MPAAEDSQIYRELMRFKPDELTPNAWAVKAGVSRTVWADMRRHGNPSRRTLEKLLTAAGSSLAEFEALRLGTGTLDAASKPGALAEKTNIWGPASLEPLRLVATELAGRCEDRSDAELLKINEKQCIERLSRPPSLAADRKAYAITVVSDSMWPRFRRGRYVAISPRSPVTVGDDVLVLLNEGRSNTHTLAFLGQLVTQTADYVELRQFNPGFSWKIAAGEIASIHKAVGELI